MAHGAQSVASLAIALDRTSRQPLYRQIYQQLREIILSGRLAAGALLPSTRTLTRELEVSRTTLELAFDQLHADGYIEGRVGSGTYVASLPFNAPIRATPNRGRQPSGSLRRTGDLARRF